MYNLQKKYKEEIRGNLKESLGIDNIMNVPALEKVVISVGAGEGVKDAKLLQNMADTVSLIAGQRAVITKAKKICCRVQSA
jgi:large subunit ribosomal protein L5